jgi:hypothetical protein
MTTNQKSKQKIRSITILKWSSYQQYLSSIISIHEWFLLLHTNNTWQLDTNNNNEVLFILAILDINSCNNHSNWRMGPVYTNLEWSVINHRDKNKIFVSLLVPGTSTMGHDHSKKFSTCTRTTRASTTSTKYLLYVYNTTRIGTGNTRSITYCTTGSIQYYCVRDIQRRFYSTGYTSAERLWKSVHTVCTYVRTAV